MQAQKPALKEGARPGETMQGAKSIAKDGGRGGSSNSVLQPRPEVRAAIKLLGRPATVPEANTLVSRMADRRRQPQLHAQDDLYAIGKWTRELMTAEPSDDSSMPAEVVSTLRSRMAEWKANGEQACAEMTRARDSAVADVHRGSSALTADLGRLRKCARREDCDDVARAREQASTEVALVPGVRTTVQRVEHGIEAPNGLVSY
mmetsp:Transcript_12765/g.32653  ORF Transcript_12765/g.32653 Transcript_12765/m.32653 type:complete len:204 (+) Transcript_12765:12-623(+)